MQAFSKRSVLSDGVIGNTSDFGSEESRFEPWSDNSASRIAVRRMCNGNEGTDVPCFIHKPDNERMIDRETLIKMTEDHLAGGPVFLIDVIIKPGNIILVFIDSDQEVNISHCAEVSRFIESRLDREKEDFELRVSSAGIDHPYRFLRQYRKNIGRQVQVLLVDGSVVKGTLTEANEKFIEVMPLKKKGKKKMPPESPQQVLMEQIRETKGIVTFD